MSNYYDYIEKARTILTDAGILYEPLDCSGEMAYRGTTKKPNSLTGRYKFHLDDRPVLWFCNRHNGDDDKGHRVKLYSDDEWQSMTEADREAVRERVRRDQKTAQEKREKARQEAAREAKDIWSKCSYATDNNAYLKRKGVTPLGDMMQEADGRLVLPMLNSEGETVSLQFIAGDSSKRFLPGGEKKGSFFPIPAKDKSKTGPLLIGEGVATVLSCCMATGYAGLVAFDAGNLLPVAEIARAKYPQREIILAADNDIHDDGKPNVGVLKATEAAKAVGAKLAICPTVNGRKADFNDLHQATDDGLERVRVCIEKARAEAEKPCLPAGFTIIEKGRKAGLWKLEEKGDEVREYRLGPPLRVLGRTRDEQSKNWGILLEWKDPAGVPHRKALPDEALQKQGTEWAAMLAADGYSIEPGMHRRFLSFLSGLKTNRFITNTSKVGWYQTCFVLPDVSIGAEDGLVVLQSLDCLGDLYQTGGTLEGWQELARLCAGNSRFTFALCAGFAGPLLKLAGLEGGGFSFEGTSSCGKTSCLQIAASVWGGPSHVRRWRATGNGIESVSSMHNDGLLVLDEIGEVSSKELSGIAYMLANGSGKMRAGRSGGARQSASWRLLFLSSGELGLADKLREDGLRAMAGQEVRFVGVPIGTENVKALNGLPSAGVLVGRIKEITSQHYGHASRAFLGWVVKNFQTVQEALPDAVAAIVQELCPEEAGEQVRRVAQRFAVVRVAGAFAKAAGVLPEELDEAEAVRSCFSAWLENRGSVGASEDAAILSAVRLFIEQHGASRFQDIEREGATCINRVGFRRKAGDRTEFIILSESFKEVVRGFAEKRAKEVLREAGWLRPGEKGKYTAKATLPELQRVNCYIVVLPEE